MAALDNVEKSLKILRELGLLVVLGGVLYFLGPEAPRIAAELKKASVSEVDLGVVKLKVEQAKTALQTALQVSSDQAGPEDTKVPAELKPIADALQSIRDVSSSVAAASTTETKPSTQSSSFWVYLGARRGNVWQTSLFDLQELPAPDSIVRPTLDVFGRRRAPDLVGKQWTKGETVGVLKAGQAAKVLRVERVPGTNARDLWWAEVVPQ